MTIATCPKCSNSGYLGDRFCSCPFADTLRDRIEAAPEFAEFRRKRAEVDHMMARIKEPIAVLRTVPVPVAAPPDVRDCYEDYNRAVLQQAGAIGDVQAYEDHGVTWAQLRAARRRPAD